MKELPTLLANIIKLFNYGKTSTLLINRAIGA
jgi:hypothetical protein